jgi:predicted anti-sigma-YlaC factor YlaD
MNDACQRYLENPEANPEHVNECAECRALFDALGVSVEDRRPRLSMEDLPLAPWEGARHRPWGLIAAAAISVLTLSILFFIYAGTSPLSVLSAEMSRLEMMREIFRLGSTAVRNAPLTWQVTIGVLFVVVNTILVLLLRRAPRGIDA